MFLARHPTTLFLEKIACSTTYLKITSHRLKRIRRIPR